MKRYIRTLGIDDGFFRKGQKQRVLLVGALLRGNDELEGVFSEHIEPDGRDATEAVVRIVKKADGIKAVLMNGLTFAGFNVVDIHRVRRECHLPVVAIMRRKPDYDAIKRALRHLPDGQLRWQLIRRAGRLRRYADCFWYQCAGKFPESAIKANMRKAKIPESVRLAHMIASGVTYGRSTKRA